MEKDVVMLRGTKNGLLVILDEEKEFPIVKKKLEEKFNSALSFFNGAEVTIDFGQREVLEEQRQEIHELLNDQYGLKQVRFLCGEGDKLERTKNHHPRLGAARNHKEERETLLIKRTMRSGQSVNYFGNVVVFGDVNPGAEVIAGGDIIVFGSLRGVAHAGAEGDEEAVVAAYQLLPTQLRIANFITRSPDEDVKRPITPEIAKIKNGMIIIESYNLYGEKR